MICIEVFVGVLELSSKLSYCESGCGSLPLAAKLAITCAERTPTITSMRALNFVGICGYFVGICGYFVGIFGFLVYILWVFFGFLVCILMCA